MAHEAVTQSAQLPAKLRSIIQLTVIHDAVFLIPDRKDHRLGAALRVDDRKPAMEESTSLRSVASAAVRTSALHSPEHPRYRILFQTYAQSSGDPAHTNHSLLRDIICGANQKRAWSRRRGGILISGDTI